MDVERLSDTEELATADDFVERLEPSPARWPPDPRGWLFRGHADARWPLVPAALREDVVLSVDPRDRRRGPRRTHAEQTLAEHDLLRKFFRALDERGLPIPEDSQRHRTAAGLHAWAGEVVREAASGKASWPPIELWSQMALAQHYGIPTRLLDWALSAYIATYFAAKRGAQYVAGKRRPQEGATHLAVWAFDARFLEAVERRGGRAVVSVVTAPGAVIPNIVGQRGLFTVHQVRAAPDSLLEIRGHDELVMQQAAELGAAWLAAERVPLPLFVRLTLPYEQAPRLLRLLAYRGVDASLVFAGHQGAAESVREEMLWDRPAEDDRDTEPSSFGR